MLNLVSVTDSNTLNFNYTVQAGDTSPDLEYAGTTALALNGGTIQDAASNTYDADLTLPAPGASGSLGANKAIVIDTTGPQVSNVSSTHVDGSFTTGEVIPIDVTFDEAVTITGTPQLTLETGTTDRTINYSSGSGTSTLTFNYTVQAGDTSADLDYTAATALVLNSGTIKDAAGNDATLTLPAPGASGSLAANKAIVIDTTAPVITITSHPADPTNLASFSIGFSTNETVTGFNCTLLRGSTVIIGPINCFSPVTGSVSSTGTYTVTIDATDLAGIPGSESFTWSVDLTPPDTTITAAPANPSTTSTASFSIASSDTGTGVAGTECSLDGPTFAACNTPTLQIYSDLTDGSHTFRVRAVDNAGNPDPTPASYTWVIDTTAPWVTNVSSPHANGAFTTGEVIPITITFTEAVNVSGTPQITLETGSTNAVVDYTGGTGTTTLAFTYTVQAGDTSTDLDYVATTSLALNSGTIQDGAGNNASLTLPPPGAGGSLGANKAIVLYTALAITSPNNVTFVVGNPSSFTVTTSGGPIPTISRTGTLPSGITFTDNGDGTGTLAGTPALGTIGTYPLTFTAQNGASPDAIQNFTISVNGPPSVSSINSVADTGDGQVVEEEHTTAAITQLLVIFNKDINATDAATTGNYHLVLDGSVTDLVNSASYNNATFTTTLDLNGGTQLPDGRYTLTVDGDIEDTLGAPIGADFVRHFVVDSGNPSNLSVITVQGNNPIIDGATIDSRFSSIQVTFNEDLNNAGGGSGTDDVTNPLNYLLLQAGQNGSYDTSSCLAFATNGNNPLVDDIRVPTGPVTYENHSGTGPFVATVQLNGGTALPNGTYRLLICGTTSLIDLAGNTLNGGSDVQLGFTVLVMPRSQSNPATGFAPGIVTTIARQPAEKAYADLGSLWLEIPDQKVQVNITGVPLTKNGWDLTWLGDQAGWLEGTAYPTWNGNTVLTAHNYTPDGAQGPFAQLKDMKYGDKLIIHFNGAEYTYSVKMNSTVAADDTTWLRKHEELDWLTLITCQTFDEKSGEYLYRQVVRAVLVSVEEE